MSKEKIKKFIFKPKVYTTVILCSIIVLSSIIIMWPGIIKGYDLEYHLTRIDQIAKCIEVGDIKAAVYPDLSGYGSGLFYPQLFLYIPALLVNIGTNILTSYKIFIIIINTSITLIMYFCTKSITSNRKTAIISSLLYSTCAYKLTVGYVFAALGALQAIAFIPLVILGMYEIIYRDSKKWYILTIGILGLIFTHLISLFLIVTFLCLPIAIINIKILIKDKKRLKHLLYAAIITVLLSAFFILPFLEQILNYDFVLNKITTETNIVYYVSTFPYNILGIYCYRHINNTKYIASFIGVGTLLFIYSLLYIITKWKNKEKQDSSKYFKLLYFIATIYLILIAIKPLWKYASILKCIQFTYRFQLIISLIYCILAASFVTGLQNKMKKWKSVYIFFIFCTVILNTALVKMEYENRKVGDKEKFKFEYSFGSGIEYIPFDAYIEKMNQKNINKEIKLQTNNKDLIYKIKQKESKYIVTYSNNLNKNTYIQLPILYYKGYKIVESTCDKDNLPDSDNGCVKVYIQDKEGKFTVQYTETIISKIGNITTIAALICVISVIYIKKYKKQ